jgi:quercetin dioxygenase-like cupin family protein
MTDKDDRLREPPAERLATPFALFALRAAAEELWQEQGVSGHGHRQKVLARHGGATVALFVFERGASLAPHAANGTVVIQCIDGELEVSTDGHPQHLAPGSVLVMAPRVRHAVRAVERAVMLLTVALHSERPGA